MNKSVNANSIHVTSDEIGVVCLRITPGEYCRLAVSVRKLVRCDDMASGTRGLQDLETGERFVIREKDLFRPTVSRDPPTLK